MSRPLRMLPSARFAMLDASDFYDSKSEGLGDRFLSDVDRSFGLIQEAPRHGRSRFEGFTTLACTTFHMGFYRNCGGRNRSFAPSARLLAFEMAALIAQR